MTINTILLSKPQFDLVSSTSAFPAFVGGFGSGKTEALVDRALMLKAKYPTGNVGYYLPTFDLVAMIAIPRFEEKLEEMKSVNPDIAFKVVKSPRPMIMIENCGAVIFRTMDTPSRIIGYQTMDSLVDELDTLKEKDAKDVWRRILARNRQLKPDGARNTIAVGTTPEGFKFVYSKWGKEPKAGYELIKASTYSNQKHLPDDYIQDLRDDYPANLIDAYIMGEFVNLVSGSVYPRFDRVLNGSTENVGLKNDIPENLHIGMDFNVTKMAAVVFVQRDNWPHAVFEFSNIFDTPAMIKAIRATFPKNKIYVYPDSSGGSRKSLDASESDLSLLGNAGFYVMSNPSNPRVKDRVLAMNAMIENGEGIRRMKVNLQTCPNFVEGLEKQAYDANGEPDKTSGLDHHLDAGGYFIAYTFPVRGKTMNKVAMVNI